MRIFFIYRVLDGMYILEGQVAGWAASPNGCSDGGGGGGGGNTPPTVSASASTGNASWGENVSLFGTINDPDSGDTHTRSWTQIKTSAEPSVAIINSGSSNASFTAPSVNTTLRFRFTATDSSNASDSDDVQVLISQQGGGGGGSGGSGTGTSTGTISGSAGCGQSNLPATASVPATYTISEGFQGQIQATNGDDPDNSPGGCINGVCEPAGVKYAWTVTDGKGLMSNGSLSGRTTSLVSFTAPQVTANTTIGLQLAALDATGCGNLYPINLVVENFIVNNNPNVILTYDVQGQNLTGDAPSGNIVVASPATIDLDASGSSDPDDDPITFAWQKSNESLSSGSTVLSPANATATLTALSGTDGSVTVTVTVSDDRGGQRAQGLTFVFVEPDDLAPLAVAVAMKDGLPVSAPLGNGEEIYLDAGSSTVPDGTQQEIDNLVFEWTQTSGTQVFTKDLDQKMARARITDIEQEETLVFRLLVRNGAALDSDLIQIAVEPRNVDDGSGGSSDIVYPVCGAGPLGDGSALQTTVIIDNLSGEDVDDVRIAFYDTDGDPVDMDYRDLLDPENSPKPWDSDQPFTIAGLSSRVIEFVAPGGAAPAGTSAVQSGWAQVTSTGLLRGSTRFQLIYEEDGSLLQDVGIPNSTPGRDFLTAFRVKDEFAFAIANHGDSRIVVNLFLYDLADPTTPVDDQVMSLGSGEMEAIFLAQLFDFEDLGIEEGHLRINSEREEDFSLTGLITLDGFFFSAQSISRIR